MNILMTGSSGFIGKQVRRTLELKHNLSCPTREALRLAETDSVLYVEAVKNDSDLIVHLAHPRAYTTPSSLPEAVGMMRNVLEVSRVLTIPVLYTSTMMIFTGHSTKTLIEPDEAPSPNGVYPETKFICETLANLYRKNHGSKIYVMRPTYVYDVGLEDRRVVSKFIANAKNNQPITLYKYENGFQCFDFLHLLDLAASIDLAVESLRNDAVNVGTGRAASVREIAEMIITLMNSRSEINVVDMEGNAPYYVPHPRMAEETLGWKAQIGLEEGLRSMIQSKGVGT